MKRIILIFICLIALVGCGKDKSNDVTIIFDDYKFEYIVDNEFSINDIEKINNYEYIDLYIDNTYETKFNGKVNKDITLYLKYKKYYNVNVITDKENIALTVYEDEKLNMDDITIKGYQNYKLFTDVEKTKEYSNSVITSDITLYLDEYYTISIYYGNDIKEKILLNKNELLDKNELTTKYNTYNFYTDKDFENIFDFNMKITSDINIYLERFYLVNIYEDNDIKEKIYVNENGKLDQQEIINKYKDYLFYSDKDFKTEYDFSKIIENDIDIYIEYLYKDVTIKTEKEDIILSIYKNDKVNIKDIINKGYSNFKLYTDVNKTQEYKNDIITEDIILYLDICNLVNIYSDKTIKEKVLVNKNGLLDQKEYQNRYAGYKFFIDEELKTEFNFNKPITSDINIYLSGDKEKVTVQIIVDNYTQIYTLNKGDHIILSNISTYRIPVLREPILYYDENYTYVYDYGPVENDLVLYQKHYDYSLEEMITIAIISLSSDHGWVYKDIKKGESIDLCDAPIITGEERVGLYYDREFTQEYKGEPLYEAVDLFLKTQPYNEDDKLVTLRFDYNTMVYLNGLQYSIKHYKPDYEIKVKVGTVFGPYSARIGTHTGAYISLYNVDAKKIHDYEPITKDTDFIVICLPYIEATTKPDNWYIEAVNGTDEYITYNNEENKELIYEKNSTQKIITIIDENDKYQIYVSLTTIITPEDIYSIIGSNDFDFEDIIVSDNIIIYI